MLTIFIYTMLILISIIWIRTLWIYNQKQRFIEGTRQLLKCLKIAFFTAIATEIITFIAHLTLGGIQEGSSDDGWMGNTFLGLLWIGGAAIIVGTLLFGGLIAYKKAQERQPMPGINTQSDILDDLF